jgi:hypothetical protein
MLTDPYTGAQGRRLPTGPSSRPLAGAHVPPRCSEHRGVVGRSRQVGPIRTAYDSSIRTTMRGTGGWRAVHSIRRRRSCNATMDCVEAKVRQFDSPSVRHGHVSKLLQLGNGHFNSGICPEVRIQCCHCHAGTGFRCVSRKNSRISQAVSLSGILASVDQLLLLGHVYAGPGIVRAVLRS